jgi:hypothetical protein
MPNGLTPRVSGQAWTLSLLPSGILLLGAWVATQLGSWAWLSGSDYVPDYSDLRQITSTADCIASNESWSLLSPTCDPNGRAYNYPSIWARAFAVIGVGQSDTGPVGVALIVLLATTVGLLSLVVLRGQQSTSRFLVWVGAAVSPPLWLAMDRGNSDIIVLGVVSCAALLALARIPILPGLTVATAGLLKVFAFGSGAMLLGMRRHRLWTLVAFGAGTAIALWLLRPELALISARTPRSDWMSFGVSVIPIRLQHVLPGLEGNGRAIGLAAVAVFLLGLCVVLMAIALRPVRTAWLSTARGIAQGEAASVFFLAGSGAVLVAYLVGTSYDYRLMFCLLAIAGFCGLRE